ncbi:MAG: glucose 1-dehydrogenase [Opitutales bacterium]
MQTLENKVAFVTGGTSGIGRTSAVALAQAGAKVVVTGRRESEGETTVQHITDAGGEGFYVRTDVANETDIQKAVEVTLQRFGRLDIAFNNAGVEITGAVTELNHEDFTKVFNINVWGVLASMKHEIPAMLKNGGGSIINVSSVAGQIGMPGVAVYVGSKHAVEGVTKTAALEYAKEGIRVNAIAPALIKTDMADRFAGKEGEMREQLESMHPIGRAGEPEEIATAVVWLAGSGSSFVTGTTLNVDGGWLAQ